MPSSLASKLKILVLLLVISSPVFGQNSTETLLPTNLNFDYVSVGSESASKTVVVKNTGVAATTISSIVASGDFVQTNNCPVSPSKLAAGASCSVSVFFWPSALGNRNGALKVTDDAVGSLHVISLSGIGVGSAYVWGRDTWIVPGTSHRLRILGNEDLLYPGDTPTVATFPGTVVVNYVVVGSPRDLTISVTVPDGTPSGFQDLVITDGSLSHTISDALRVVDDTVPNPSPLAPAISGTSSVSLGTSTTLTFAPNPLFQGESSFTLDLGRDVAVGTITLQPDGTLQAPISVTPWAIPGTRSVHLTAGPYAFLAERGFAIDFGPLVNQLTLNTAPVTLPAGYTASVFATADSTNGIIAAGQLCVNPQNYAFVLNQAEGPSPPNSFSLSVFNLNPGSFGSFVRYLPNLDVSGQGGLLENCTFLPSTPGIIYLSAESYGCNSGSLRCGQTITAVDTTTGAASLFKNLAPNINLDPLSTDAEGNLLFSGSLPNPDYGAVYVLNPAGNLIKTCVIHNFSDELNFDPLTGKVLADGPVSANFLGFQTIDLSNCTTMPRSNGPTDQFDEGDFAPAAGKFGNQFFTGVQQEDHVDTFLPVSYTDPDQSTPERYVTFGTGFGAADTARFDREGKYLLIADTSWHQALDVVYRIPGYQPPVPVASLSAQNLTFGTQDVGITTSPQTLTITNTGSAPLTFADISADGEFTLDASTTCVTSTPVLPGNNCIIGVTFTPASSGNQTGALSITDNANAAPQLVPLAGTGTAPVVSLSPSSLTFTSQTVGTISTAKTVTLTNTGTGTLNLTALTPSGDFALDPGTTCSTLTPIAPGGTCTIAVTFNPTVVGTEVGSIFLEDNAGDSPQSLPLSAVATQPGIAISPSIVTFPNQTVGTFSSTVTLTLTNTGAAALGVSGVTLTGANVGDFSVGSACTTVAPGGSCNITVFFRPAATGMRTAAISIADSNPDSPQTVALSGVGIAPEVAVSSSDLTFGSQVVGTTSASLILTLVNTGTATLSIGGLGITGDFALKSNMLGCTSLNPVLVGLSCTLGVTFSPTATGTRTGTLTIKDNTLNTSETINLSGTGASLGVSLAPSSVLFGSQAVGSTSATQHVTVTNTGTSNLNFSTLSVQGDYSIPATSCSASSPLAPNTACTISVTFTPSAVGTRTGSVTVTDDGGDGTQVIPLSGTGSLPGILLAPSDLTFALQFPATISPAQSVAVTNTGSKDLTFTSLQVAGRFALDPGTTCSIAISVPPGGNCLIAVNFQPQTDSTTTGQVTITDNASGGVQTIALTGTGTAAAIHISSPSVTFPAQGLNTTSPTATIYITSTGAKSLVLNNINVTGDFAFDGSYSTCALNAPLAPSATCLLGITFTPTAIGNLAGTLTLGDNATGGTQIITLSGIGATTGVYFSPSSVAFGSQVVGTPSSAQSVLMYNSGLVDLTINSVSVSGDFALDPSTTCSPSTLLRTSKPPCTIAVIFNPTAVGTRTGSLTVYDSGVGSPQVVPLVGVGIGPGVLLSSSSLIFGSRVVGTTSGAQIVSLKNTGTAPLDFSGITASNDFSIDPTTTTCSTSNSLAIGSICTLGVTFTPAATGARTGTVTITDNAIGGIQTVTLSGTGIAPGLSLSRSSLAFGSQVVGTTGTVQTVTLTNSGTAAFSFGGFTVSGDFALDAATTTCAAGNSLAAGSSCTIGTTFTPTATGTRTGGVVITDSFGSGTQTIALSGTGIEPGVSLAPSSLAFGSTTVGTTSASQSVVLTNTGTSNLTISGLNVVGEFALDPSTTCSTTSPVNPGGTCSMVLTFTPASPGARTGAVLINDDGSGGTQAVALSGTGTAAGVLLAPSNLDFGNQGVLTASPGQTITVTNSGDAPLTISNVMAVGDFAASGNCLSNTVAVGGTCTIGVTFLPTATGNRSGSVVLSDNALNSPQTIPLSGNGVVAYSLSSSGSSSELLAGTNSTTFLLSAATTYGFTGSISLSCSGNSSASCSFNPPSLTPGQTSTLTLSGLNGISGGSQLAFNVNGTSGGQSAALPLSVSFVDYSLSTTGTSATVTAGQTATYTVNIAPLGGFKGTVSLGCSGAPRASTCTPSAGSVTLDGTSSTSVIVTVTTTARSAIPGPAQRWFPKFPLRIPVPFPWAMALVVALVGAISTVRARGSRGNSENRAIIYGPRALTKFWPRIVFAGLMLTVLTWFACGGGSVTPPPPTVGTPAGTYVISVAGTYSGPTGTLSHTTSLNLTVN